MCSGDYADGLTGGSAPGLESDIAMPRRETGDGGGRLATDRQSYYILDMLNAKVVELVPDRKIPDTYRVERYLAKDGAVEQTVFFGPNADERAQRYHDQLVADQ